MTGRLKSVKRVKRVKRAAAAATTKGNNGERSGEDGQMRGKDGQMRRKNRTKMQEESMTKEPARATVTERVVVWNCLR